MKKKILIIGIIVVMLFAVVALVGCGALVPDWNELYQTAVSWGFESSQAEFESVLLGANGCRYEAVRGRHTAFRIFQRNHGNRFRGNEELFIYDLVHGGLEWMGEYMCDEWLTVSFYNRLDGKLLGVEDFYMINAVEFSEGTPWVWNTATMYSIRIGNPGRGNIFAAIRIIREQGWSNLEHVYPNISSGLPVEPPWPGIVATFTLIFIVGVVIIIKINKGKKYKNEKTN